MPFTGSGNFSRLYNWVQDKTNGIKINASRMDAEMDGFAAGLSNCIAKDGQTTLTADIPFNNRRLTGLGDATADTDAMNRQSGDARFLRAYSGGILQSLSSSYTTWSTVTAQIPLDDTVPQNTEGTQLVTVTITPTSTTSKIRIRVSAPLIAPLAATTPVLAIFRSGQASAIRSGSVGGGNSTAVQSGYIEVEDSPATTSAVTYSFRIGPTTATSLFINGNGGGRLLGGSSGVVMVAEEIRA